MTRLSSADHEARQQRLRAVAAEAAIAESEALIAELHDQLDRANAAAVRMARRLMADRRLRAA